MVVVADVVGASVGSGGAQGVADELVQRQGFGVGRVGSGKGGVAEGEEGRRRAGRARQGLPHVVPERRRAGFGGVGLEGGGRVGDVVVARGFCALFVEVLQEFLNGAGRQARFVVAGFGGVVVDPVGFSGAADAVEQGGKVFLFAVAVAGAGAVEVDEVVAFVVLSRRVAVVVGVHEGDEFVGQVAQAGEAADGDDAAGFAAVLLGAEVGFDVVEDEGQRQVELFVLRGEVAVCAELLFEAGEGAVQGLPGGGVVGVLVVAVQGVADVGKPCLCRGVGGEFAPQFAAAVGMFGEGFEDGQVGEAEAGQRDGVAVVVVAAVGHEDAGDEAVEGVGVGVAVVVVVGVQGLLQVFAVEAAFVAGLDEGGGDALDVFVVAAETLCGVVVVQPVGDGGGVVAAIQVGVVAGEAVPEAGGAGVGGADDARGQAVAVVVAAAGEDGAQYALFGDGVGQEDEDVGEAARRVGVQPGDDVAAQGFGLAQGAVAGVDAQAVVVGIVRGSSGMGFVLAADVGLHGAEEVADGDGGGVVLGGVVVGAVGVQEAGAVALLFAVA